VIAKPPGRTLVPGYECTTLVARGGTAAVYRAVRTEDSSTVALKVFDIGTDEAYRRQLLAERRLHGVHDIHGVLPILDATTLEDGRRCIVMPYAEGRAVALRPDQRFEMAADLADLLDALATDPDVVPHGASRRRKGKRAWLRPARP